jgi:hypothetical protein
MIYLEKDCPSRDSDATNHELGQPRGSGTLDFDYHAAPGRIHRHATRAR